MSRRFVAIGLPDEVRGALDAAIAPVRARWPGLAWTDPAGWHVTLAYIGELPDDRVPDAERAVVDAVRAFVDDGGPGTASPAGVAGADSDPRWGEGQGGLRAGLAGVARLDRRVLALEVVDAPRGALAALGDVLQAALADAGLPVARGEVRAHVTLARARRRAPVTDELVGEVVTASPSPVSPVSPPPSSAPVAGAWPVTWLGLWTAQDRQGPARYEVTTRVSLPPPA